MAVEVSLLEMLDARERRVHHQQELLEQYHKPLICFTMNIAGPIKDSPLIRRGFARGQQLLRQQFFRAKLTPLSAEAHCAATGCEAFYVLDADPLTIKKFTTDIEDATNGVNTHKGAVFSIGITCAALGRLDRAKWSDPARVLAEVSAMTKGLAAQDFAGVTAENAATAGQKLYAQYGITGVRGQVEAGLPAALDDRFIAEHLSPGGSADLLALTYLLHFFKTEEHLHV